MVEVCAALDQPTIPLDHGAELGLVAAVNDALAWARDPRPYEEMHKHSWESVIDDFGATVRRVGADSQLGRALEAELADAVQELTLPEAPTPDDAKKRAEVALHTLWSRSLSSEAVTAAWNDLLLASQDQSASDLEWAWRRNAFLELAAHAGRGVPSLLGTLAGILDDRLLDVTSAWVQLGENNPPCAEDWPSLADEAELSQPERLDLCARLVALDPIPTRCVVCVSFDHARLTARTKVTDRIEFYPAARAEGLIGFGDASDSGPIALIPAAAAPFLPKGDDVVVAVIDLGIVNPANAVTMGASNCEALVTLVNSGLRRPTWRAMSGHILYANGWFASGFTRSDRSLPPHWADPTGTRLESLGAAVGSHIPVSAPVLQSIVAASHRLLAAQNEAIDPAGRLLLTVGVIEDACGWGSGPPTKWHKFAKLFDAAWAEATLQEDIFRVVSDILDPFLGLDFGPTEKGQLEQLRLMIRVDQPDGTVVLNMRAACENMSALAAVFPVGCAGGRQLVTMQGHLVDGPSLAQDLARRSDGYLRLLSRAVRCRNAAAHGGPLPSGTIESVLDWGKVVATSLRKAAMDALLAESGDDPRTRISKAQNGIAEAASSRKKALRCGAGIANTLFPADDA